MTDPRSIRLRERMVGDAAIQPTAIHSSADGTSRGSTAAAIRLGPLKAFAVVKAARIAAGVSTSKTDVKPMARASAA